MKKLLISVFSLLFISLISSGTPGAEARGLSGKVYFTQAKIPRRGTERKLISFARSHQAKRMKEITDKPLKERYWRGNIVAAFSKPPGDLEFQILYYDITGGERHFISPATSIFINDRKMKTFVNKFKLPRPDFKPGHKYEAVTVVKRKEVGKTRFELLGEKKKRTGKVDFGDDET